MVTQRSILTDNTTSNMKKKVTWSDFIPFLGLVLILLLFGILTSGGLFARANLIAIINTSLTVALVATGASFLYSHGGMDFSVGAVIGLSGLLTSMVAQSTQNIPMAFVVCILVSIVAMLVNGAVTIFLKIPAFIGSLCMQYICRGILASIVESKQVIIPFRMFDLDNWVVKIITIVIVFLICCYLFNFTKVGKYNKAIGGNPLAAQQAGVRVSRYRLIAYLIFGVITGIAAFLYLIRIGGVKASAGQGIELNLLFALVLGGMPLSGGAKARIQSGIIGALTVIILQYGLQMLGINSYYAQGITGILFLIVVWLRYDKDPDGLLQ